MLAWMAFVTVIGCGASVAAVAAERALRSMGRPVRILWVCAMALTVAVPLAHLVSGGAGSSARPELWEELAGGSGWSVIDAVLLVAWAVTTLVLLSNVRLAAWTLRRNERLWRVGSASGVRVSVAPGFGPGVIGAGHPRIVLPEWVLDAEPELRRLILLHEIEHVKAADTRLLLGSVMLVSLLPWSLPLWWQLHRLRAAVETDCDSRVVAATGDARAYARALVAVAGKPTLTLRPATGLVSGRSELERRIRLITARERGRGKAVAAGALLASAVAMALLLLPAPRLPAPVVEPRVSETELPPSAIIYLSVGEAGGAAGPAR